MSKRKSLSARAAKADEPDSLLAPMEAEARDWNANDPTQTLTIEEMDDVPAAATASAAADDDAGAKRARLETALVCLAPAAATVATPEPAVESKKLVQLAPLPGKRAQTQAQLVHEYRCSVQDSVMEVASGQAHVTHPDMALHLWSLATDKYVHAFEVDASMFVRVTRSEPKEMKDGVLVPVGEQYINLSTKVNQMFPGVDFMGLTMLSPFCKVQHFRHGPTVETGLEGSRGKPIKAEVVPPGQERYEIMLTNASFNTGMNDADKNNPVVTQFMLDIRAFEKRVLTLVMTDSASLVKVRALVKAGFAGKRDLVAPANDAELVDYVHDRHFKGKIAADAQDQTMLTMTLGAPCYRKPKTIYINRRAVKVEADVPPPSQMFALNAISRKGKEQIHNDVPLFRARRADEVVPGVVYDSPYVRVPSANSVLTSADVVAVLFQPGFYESKMDRCGVTFKQIAYLWLNTEAALQKAAIAAVVPCDPRYAVPMAGHYLGPLGYEGAPPAGAEPFVPAAPAAPVAIVSAVADGYNFSI